MLRFFRKIRKSLLSSNSARKYLLYAIGEIFLVMTGILLALQVSNWNESKKLDQKEVELVKALHTELLIKRDYDDRYLINNSYRVERSCRTLIENMGKQNTQIFQDSFNVLLTDLLLAIYAPRSAKFEQVVNGEDYSFIRNDSLRMFLADYKFRMDYVLTNYNSTTIRYQKMEDYLDYNYTHRGIINNSSKARYSSINDIGGTSFLADHKNLFADLVFENLVSNILMWNTYLKNRLKQNMEQTELIIQFIDQNYDL